MISFKEWLIQRDETFAVSPSVIDDEGDGIERLLRTTPQPALDNIPSQNEMPPLKRRRHSRKK